ncbi:MAG: cell division ATP-binding protein FtsE [Candidatus Komeilibacteria bacterium RIFCSPLOWO2_01_FULL_45_10]|uniref:Cell division ATP-binding protein FtsE n=1 Tax=Candidatus Komeilibacteria bacterium RIFCSPLOWO2_01_FULL_45_10 TaxID=1798550 RepID=A0A1G2BKB8_9BACT|nr:MAG: cell division ATP-binding protein FtsE [Candidatus Komeilibacteria bacterium RIFCSPLOWO2_01_FULL_45_10]
MIKFINISKYYKPNIVALKNVNLEIEPSEFVSIVGQSGTGKTTLIRLLIAEEKPSEGRITVGGWDITNIKSREVPYLRRQIGVVFQDFKLLPKKTVFENIAFALQTCGSPKETINRIVPQVVKIVGLEGKADRYPFQLSGGEAQRVVIARSLVHKPKLLVADEPTGNLDSINTREIIDLLKKINELGTTVILVTHNRDVVNGLKKRVITIDEGQIIGDQSKGRYVL